MLLVPPWSCYYLSMSYQARVRVLVFCCSLLLTAGSLEAQRIQNILFGDLKVDQPEGVNVPQSFWLVLKDLQGHPLNRDSVAANGRYRFFNVSNGEYVLSVEVNGQEVYRDQFILSEPSSTDVRKDIHLEWKVSGGGYARSADQNRLLKQARAAAKEGNQKEAVKLLEKLVDKDSNDFEAWTELGTAQFQEKKLDDAAKAYEKSLEQKPDYLPALVNLGKLRLAQKKFDQAVEPLEKAVAQDPQRAESQYLLGEAYLGIRKGSLAVGYLNEAIRLDPDGMADVHLRLAQLYDLAGMKARAATEYEQFLQKRPNAPQKKELEQYISKNKGS